MLARRRSRSRSSPRRYAILALTLFLAGGAVYLIWLSPAFVIQAVEVEGGELAPGVDFNQAIGQNLLFYKPGFSLEDAHQAAAFDMDKRYLGRSVKITFTARERYAIWCVESQGACFWVDQEGNIFAEAPDIKGPLILRLIRDESERQLNIGEKVLDENLFVNLKAAFVLLEKLDIQTQEFKIENLKFREAVARTNGPAIYFSLQDDPSFGENVVRQLRESGEWNSVTYLDLRVPGRAYYSN